MAVDAQAIGEAAVVVVLEHPGLRQTDPHLLDFDLPL
jgi:hypothetical protein